MERWEPGFSVDVIRLQGKNEFAARFRCPWCGDNTNSRVVTGCELPRDQGALLVVCDSVHCRKPALITVRFTFIDSPGDPEVRPVAQAIFPNPRSHYAPDGVPKAIAEDFEEALNCQGAGFLYGATVVGRRALQNALIDKGATKRELVDQINEISDEELPKRLKVAAHHVRLIGNDAAHAREVTADDVTSLVGFVALVLEQMYILPYQLAKQTRTIQPKHLPGASKDAGPRSALVDDKAAK